jgi:hypothetical protein
MWNADGDYSKPRKARMLHPARLSAVFGSCNLAELQKAKFVFG